MLLTLLVLLDAAGGALAGTGLFSQTAGAAGPATGTPPPPHTCDSELAARVRPFNDTLLPKSQVGGELLPGLGRLMLLDTFMKPMAIESMGTSFGIHRHDGSVEGIRFRAPDAAAEGPAEYQYDLCQMARAGFDPAKRTVVMIPGYRTKETTSWLLAATRGWLELHGPDINVIVVSWADSNNGIYSQAVAHTIMVARQLTIFLSYLVQLAGGSLDDQRLLERVHLVGHSLGAHIAGFVGQDFGGKLGRITGLDPAGPSFDQFARSQRLDRSDARLVEVLHTNSGRLRYLKALANAPLIKLASYWSAGEADRGEGATTSGLATNGPRLYTDATAWFGIDRQIGHVDYYANDGREQPGCPADQLHICDHGRAADLYVDMLHYGAALKAAGHAGRLLAFKAPSYASFETGESFSLGCAEPLCTLDHLNQCRQERLRAQCAIPLLDFMRPLDELVAELESKHGIDFTPEADPERQPRFYFKTSAGTLLGGGAGGSHYVGDHYLLKVYLGPRAAQNFKWIEPSADEANSCSLHVKLMMPDGQASFMELGHVRPRPAGEGADSQWTISIPFVHPYGAAARAQLERLLAAGVEQRSTESDLLAAAYRDRFASAEFSSGFRHLFPQTVVLAVEETKRRPADADAPTCQLDVTALEVQPLDGRCQSLGALYGARVSLDESLPVLTAHQLVAELANSAAGLGPIATTRLATGGAKQAVRSVGSGLEAVLVEN